MIIEVPIVSAFVDESVGGNPAGVVLNAQRYSHDQKLQIAAAVNLSETAFVSPSSSADFKLEFFTPTRQIAHCGHATIATYCYLRQIGALQSDNTSKETIDGHRKIVLEGDSAYMEQVAPRYTELSQEHQIRVITSLDLKQSDLLPDVQPCVVNTGNSFLLIALRNSDAVKLINPDLKLISLMSDEFDLIGYYVFSSQTVKDGRDAGARMFAPRFGIGEESATGMAAGPLACYLHDKLKAGKSQYLIEQGHLMSPSSPSVISVRLQIENGSISSLMAGGKAAVKELRSVEI